ncbi:CIR protein PIR protein [Plasmodium vinckei vinckei]|uniref:CIR protein PIR protein n=1 Tax=Plasmodium vinckei vinckei TaxID=54757 RepID=A0A449BNC5_PLAVN|nr:CIR protein PIR protein [Plasmodium vinckei vinckei]VEV54909.1 CIR protein PIR protein [Plasmodium vinckei vinckei]
MAGWISLLKKIYDSDLVDNDVPKNMNINEYIITWLIYMLKLKDGNSIINLNDFYYQYKNQRGGHSLVSTNGKDYSNIIDNIIINKNYLMDMDKNIISKFYNLLKSLCSMYNDINKDTSYRKILSSLSTYYDNFKKYCDKNCNGCNSIPPLPTTKTILVSAHISENTSSSSSILNTLISGLSIFSVIPAFLGIAYKTIYKNKIKKNKEKNES